MQLFCERIRGADERISEIVFFDLSVRLARTLLRYPAQGRGPPSFASPSRSWPKWSARRGGTSTAACANGSGAEFYN
jgi:hypothetical protein